SDYLRNSAIRAKFLTLRARPISALAALSGLGVPKYAFTPLALPARKSGFVNNPG
ncbi:MAG: hypothetical protein JRI97_05360, partial [Deltaproteobacteria bacterium]|nr:hypothetical protein [Deltaproteobacteria bacterium]